MRHAWALAGIVGATWLLWSGIYEPVLLGFAAISVAAVVFASRKLGVVDAEGVPLAIVNAGQLTYIPWLLGQVVTSNLDVARRVIAGPRSIAPRMLTVVPSQASPAARVLYANSITLTPGTVSVRMFDDEILVHALHAEAAEGLLDGEMDRRVTALEGPT